MGQKTNRGCLGFFVGLFGTPAEPKAASASARVELKRKFLSDAEVSFFHVLQTVVGERGHIFAQVSLGQLLYAAADSRSAQASARNRYDRKTVDFLICDPKTLRPLVAIELDDSTHNRPNRQTRDEQVDELLKSAGLPLVRVKARRTYNTRELEAAIGQYLH